MYILQVKFAGAYREDVFIEANHIKYKKDLILLYDKRSCVAVFNRNDIMYIRRIVGGDNEKKRFGK